MTTQPLVSVLVPTYNGERYLEETLRCIAAQTYSNLEIIIRDDRSKDLTARIARTFAASDPRVRFVVAEADVPHGGYENLVALMKLATGDYVKCCLQDDLLEPTCIEALVAAMEAFPTVTLATSARQLIDDAGNVLPPQPFSMPLVSEDSVVPGPLACAHMLSTMLNQIGEHSTVMFRRPADPDHAFDYGGRFFGVNGDIAMWLSLLTQGDLYYRTAPLSRFRRHDEQRSADVPTVIEGQLEWVDLVETASRQGLLAPGEPTLAAVRKVVATLAGLIAQAGYVQGLDAPQVVERLCAGIQRLWAVTQAELVPA